MRLRVIARKLLACVMEWKFRGLLISNKEKKEQEVAGGAEKIVDVSNDVLR